VTTPYARGRSSDRSARSMSVNRSTGRPVGSPQGWWPRSRSLENVRLAALCGLLRCEIAEDPKGNRRRRSMRQMPRELASGSSEKWRRPVSTGVCIPGSGPAANTDDMSTDRQSQCILRTVLRTKSGQTVPAIGMTSSCTKGQMNLDGDGQQNWTETDTRSGRWRRRPPLCSFRVRGCPGNPPALGTAFATTGQVQWPPMAVLDVPPADPRAMGHWIAASAAVRSSSIAWKRR
jgi:hypothetical protein